MTTYIKRYWVFFILCTSQYSFGQAPTAKQVLLTSDSLASGNYKDVLSSFYQLALNNLTGPDKALHFTSNPFAIMLRGDSSLAENENYLKPLNQLLRRFNIDFDAKLDADFRFDGFAMGIKYSLVNARDMSASKAFERTSYPNDSLYTLLLNATSTYIAGRTFRAHLQDRIRKTDSGTPTVDPDAKPIEVKVNTIVGDLNRELSLVANKDSMTFDRISPLLREAIIKVAGEHEHFIFFTEAINDNPELNIHTERSKDLNRLLRSFASKPLWTIGISDTSYSSGALFKSVVLSSQFLKGFGDTQHVVNMELDISAMANFTHDSTQAGRSLSRQVFHVEPGINFILKSKGTRQSYLELKISGTYSNVWKGLYGNEQQITNTLNGVLRIRVFNEIWIPVTVKYDIDNGDVFGFLSVKTNFKALGSLF